MFNSWTEWNRIFQFWTDHADMASLSLGYPFEGQRMEGLLATDAPGESVTRRECHRER
jgi:hypothetical protein